MIHTVKVFNVLISDPKADLDNPDLTISAPDLMKLKNVVHVTVKNYYGHKINVGTLVRQGAWSIPGAILRYEVSE